MTLCEWVEHLKQVLGESAALGYRIDDEAVIEFEHITVFLEHSETGWRIKAYDHGPLEMMMETGELYEMS